MSTEKRHSTNPLEAPCGPQYAPIYPEGPTLGSYWPERGSYCHTPIDHKEAPENRLEAYVDQQYVPTDPLEAPSVP